jgi:transcriptional regulator with XRE-family HTH domain
MVNINKLKGKIVENGQTQKACAEYLGMAEQTFTAKLRGRANFTIPEVYALAEFLRLRDDDIIEIFFNKKLA